MRPDLDLDSVSNKVREDIALLEGMTIGLNELILENGHSLYTHHGRSFLIGHVNVAAILLPFKANHGDSWEDRALADLIYLINRLQELDHIVGYIDISLSKGCQSTCPMDLLPDTCDYGLLMRWECWERFPRHRGLAILLCITWCMPGSLTSGFIWSHWRGKCSRHSRRMRNPQFYGSDKRPMILVH